MFRRLDEQEAGQVVAWRPPALERPEREDDAVRAALQAAGIEGGFQVSDRQGAAAASTPVTVHTNEQLASLVATELAAQEQATADASAEGMTDETPSEAGANAAAGDAVLEPVEKDDGFEAGANSVRESLSADVRSAIDTFTAEHQRWRVERDGEIVALATALAAAVLRRELVADPVVLEQLVRETLAPFDGDSPVPAVQLHPLDLAAIEAVDGAGRGIELSADASLSRGDCRVRSGASLIEAGVTDRLSALLADELS